MTPPDKTDMLFFGAMLGWLASFMLWAIGGR